MARRKIIKAAAGMNTDRFNKGSYDSTFEEAVEPNFQKGTFEGTFNTGSQPQPAYSAQMAAEQQAQAANTAKVAATSPLKRKFKLYGEDIDMDDDFINEIKNSYINKYGTERGLSDVLDLIRNGSIDELNESGSFVGTDVGNTQKSKKAARWFGVTTDTTARQDVMAKLNPLINSIHKKRSVPKPIVGDQFYLDDLDAGTKNISYKVSGFNEDQWDKMNEIERLRASKDLFGHFDSSFEKNRGVEYDAKKHLGISKEAYNAISNGQYNLTSLYNKWIEDGQITDDEYAEAANLGIDLRKWLTSKKPVTTPAGGITSTTPTGTTPVEPGDEEPTPLTPEQIQEIRNNVSKGWGYDSKWIGNEDGDPNDLRNWELSYEGNPINMLYQHVGWDPNSKEELAGWWMNGRYHGDKLKNPYNPEENPEEFSKYEEDIFNLNKSVEDYDPYVLNSTQSVRSDLRNDYFGNQGYINLSGRFTSLPEHLQVFMSGDKNNSTYTVFDRKTSESFEGKLDRDPKTGEIFLKSDDGERINLGKSFSKDKSLEKYDFDFTYKTKDGIHRFNVRTAKASKVAKEALRTNGQIRQGDYDQLPKNLKEKFVKRGIYWVPKNPRKRKDEDPNWWLENNPVQTTPPWQVEKEGKEEEETKVPFRKNGGSLNFNKINKYQAGGGFLIQTKPTQETLDAQHTENTRSASMNEVFGRNYSMTTADKLQIGALAADLAGLVAGFTGPVGNMVGAGLGAGSTIANYGADLSRNGFNWKDLGYAGMSLGLDAVSAIPFAGQAAKGTKVLKAISRSKDVLGAAFSAAGLVDGVRAINAISEKGSEATIDDYRALMNGLQALASGAKRGIKQLGTTKATDVSVNVGGKNVSFKNADAANAYLANKKGYDESLKALNDYKRANPKVGADDAKLRELQGNVTKAKESVFSTIPTRNPENDAARKAFEDYRRANPNANHTDAKFKELQANVSRTDSKNLLNGKIESERGGFMGMTWAGKNADGKRQFPIRSAERKPIVTESSMRTVTPYWDKNKTNWAERWAGRYMDKMYGISSKPTPHQSSGSKPMSKEAQIAQSKKDGAALGQERRKSRADYDNEVARKQADSKDQKRRYLADKREAKAKDDAELGEKIGRIREQRQAQDEMSMYQRKKQYNKIKTEAEAAAIKEKRNRKIASEIGAEYDKRAAQLLREQRQLKLHERITRQQNEAIERKRAESAERTRSNKELGREMGIARENRAARRADIESRLAARENQKIADEISKKAGERINIQRRWDIRREDNRNKLGKDIGDTREHRSKYKELIADFDASKSDLKKLRNDVKSTKSKKKKNALKKQISDLEAKMKQMKEQGKQVNVDLFKKGGIVKFSGGGSPRLSSNTNLGKAKFPDLVNKGLSAISNPTNLMIGNSLLNNQRVLDQIKKTPVPTAPDPIRLNRLKTYGVGSIQPQLSEVNQQVNTPRNLYSDSKLNVANQLSVNSEANKNKQLLHGQLFAQNAQVDHQNQQIEQQENMQNAQQAQMYKDRLFARNQAINDAKVQKIKADHETFNNAFAERKYYDRENRLKDQKLQEQIDNMVMNQQYDTDMKKFMSDEEALAAAIKAGEEGYWDKTKHASFSDYLKADDTRLNDFNERKNQFIYNYKLKALQDSQKSRVALKASGGKLEEKIALENVKQQNRLTIERQKAFNKLMEDRLKLSQKQYKFPKI